jgi:hypothetical protein
MCDSASPKNRSADTKLRVGKSSSKELRKRDVAVNEKGSSRERPKDIPESKMCYALERRRIGEKLRLSLRGSALLSAKRRNRLRSIVNLNRRRMSAKSLLDESESSANIASES